MTVIEIEAIEALDFDSVPGCESHAGCDNQANGMWIAYCGCTFMLCNSCKDKMVFWMEETPEHFLIECGICGHLDYKRNHIYQWRPL